jgi:hypothetical protein
MPGKDFVSNLLNLGGGGGGLDFQYYNGIRWKRDSLVYSITEYRRVFIIIPDSFVRSFV